MSENNELVKIEMLSDARLRLYTQITSQMEKLGYNPVDYGGLELGFELPANWPVDINAQPMLAELVVVARKLGLRIIVNDLNLIPAGVGEVNKNADGAG